jgi:hypothetical protein
MSHQSRHGEHRKPLREQWPIVTLCSKHKNETFKGQNRQGKHPELRKPIMHRTISAYGEHFPVSGGIYRPANC